MFDSLIEKLHALRIEWCAIIGYGQIPVIFVPEGGNLYFPWWRNFTFGLLETVLETILDQWLKDQLRNRDRMWH